MGKKAAMRSRGNIYPKSNEKRFDPWIIGTLAGIGAVCLGGTFGYAKLERHAEAEQLKDKRCVYATTDSGYGPTRAVENALKYGFKVKSPQTIENVEVMGQEGQRSYEEAHGDIAASIQLGDAFEVCVDKNVEAVVSVTYVKNLPAGEKTFPTVEQRLERAGMNS